MSKISFKPVEDAVEEVAEEVVEAVMTAEKKVEAAIEEWIQRHIHDSPLSQATEAFNHLRAKTPELIAAIIKEL